MCGAKMPFGSLKLKSGGVQYSARSSNLVQLVFLLVCLLTGGRGYEIEVLSYLKINQCESQEGRGKPE